MKLFHETGVQCANKRSPPTNCDTGDVWRRLHPHGRRTGGAEQRCYLPGAVQVIGSVLYRLSWRGSSPVSFSAQNVRGGRRQPSWQNPLKGLTDRRRRRPRRRRGKRVSVYFRFKKILLFPIWRILLSLFIARFAPFLMGARRCLRSVCQLSSG